MELFKTVVKKAMEINAYRVSIYEGKHIEFFLRDQKDTVETNVTVEPGTTAQIFKEYGEKASPNDLKHMQWEVFTSQTASFNVYYQNDHHKIDIFFGENTQSEIAKLKQNFKSSEISLEHSHIPPINESVTPATFSSPNSTITKQVDSPAADNFSFAESEATQIVEKPLTAYEQTKVAEIPVEIPRPDEAPEINFDALTKEADPTDITTDIVEEKTTVSKVVAPSEEISFDPEENMFAMEDESNDQAPMIETPEPTIAESISPEPLEEIAIDFSTPAADDLAAVAGVAAVAGAGLKIANQSESHQESPPPMDESIAIHDSIEDEIKQKAQPKKAPKTEDGVEYVEIRWTNEEKGSKPVSDGSNALDPLLKVMLEKDASDVHLTMGEIPCFRIDGDIVRYPEHPPMTPALVEKYFYPIMPMSNRKEFAADSDTDFAYEVKGLARFRVNIFRDRTGVGAVMRQIPATVLTAEQLGLTQNITQFAHMHKGLVVVTGPTGSGKSTTLAAVVDLINKTRSDHILTVEDPVEFVHKNQKCLVNHREVGKHTKSFSRALKAALREDPDIVLIGEMRDLETVAIAIETAETGHLVFGTLHTNTAISTVDRIIDQFPAEQQQQIRMMLSNSLMGVVAQTLLKKIGGGRCAAHEVLVVNDAVRAMIREGKTHMLGNHMQTRKSEGNVLLNDSLLKLVLDGTVDADHALGKSINRNDLMQKYEQKGVKFTKEETAA